MEEVNSHGKHLVELLVPQVKGSEFRMHELGHTRIDETLISLGSCIHHLF